MKKSFVFACFGAFCAVGAWSVSAAEGVVTADVLNIRTQPDLKSAVAVKLDKGFKVEVLGESGDFVEIAIPVTAPVYISAVYLNEGKTTAPLKMYTAGSTAAASYGVLPKGSEVKMLEIDRYGWAKIEPPAGIKLYAAKRYVAVTPDAAKPEAKVEEKKDVKPETKPEAKVEEKKDVKPETKPEAKVEEKKDVKPEAKAEAAAVMTAATEKALADIGVDLQKGTAVTVTGTLLKLENTTVPILQFVLMRNGTHEYYLCSDRFQLASYGAAPVTIRGRSFRVPSWRVPVLYIESVTPVKAGK
ncbi:SH3 domain-containing protein [uncultured Victivallis sp.]|uniref:SH3 domain-containing protein n=1 Tax=uncultured Victivallis sp. TaxID=354118 RepID=UPI0025951729|nr:SH3 domain-containing protein [uncultured Victivallis sp.]